MSHEAHTDSSNGINQTKVSFTSSFWLVVILVFLFIGALNFIQSQGHGEAEHKGEATEHLEGEKGKGEEVNSHPKAEHTDEHAAPEHH